jgi:hypothetical protein
MLMFPKNRIVRILTECVALRLGFNRKLLLCVAGLAVIAVPMMFGQAKMELGQPGPQAKATTDNAPSEVFDVASIKPNKPMGGDGHLMDSLRSVPRCTGSFEWRTEFRIVRSREVQTGLTQKGITLKRR